jgi:hypothetical protein
MFAHHFFEAGKDCDFPLEWILAEEQVENGMLFMLAGLVDEEVRT